MKLTRIITVTVLILASAWVLHRVPPAQGETRQ